MSSTTHALLLLWDNDFIILGVIKSILLYDTMMTFTSRVESPYGSINAAGGGFLRIKAQATYGHR
jgi:hypothetical protein